MAGARGIPVWESGVELAMLAFMRVALMRQTSTARPVRKAAQLGALVLLLCTGNTAAFADPEPPTIVFAAASTMVPLRVLAQSFAREDGGRVEFSFAASSTLARQVIHGARAGLFVSANRQWLDRLEGAGLLVADSRRELTGNRLALDPAGRQQRERRLGPPRHAAGRTGRVPAGAGGPRTCAGRHLCARGA